MPQEQRRLKHATNLFWIVMSVILAGILVWMILAPRVPATLPQSSMAILRTDGSQTVFKVELAITPQQQERGLMFRTQLAADAGMLFVWPDSRPISMWMKNTLIPLDMLFVTGEGKIAKIIAKAVPEDLTPLSSDVPVHAVVEIAGGEAERQNIHTGDTVQFSGFSTPP